MTKLIKPDSSLPAEVESFLQRNYSFSLYHFAISLVDVFCFPDLRSMPMDDKNTSFRDFWKKVVNDLENIGENNYKKWKEIKNKVHPFFNPYQTTISKIDRELKKLTHLHENLIENINKDYLVPTKTKGTPSKPLNILFLVWSHFIKDRNKSTVHIKHLLNLLKWFSKRIKGRFQNEEISIYFEEYEIEDDNLNKELFRYRKGELKLTEIKVEQFKKRFIIPVKMQWLEKILKKNENSNAPLITFSNGESLTIKECIENNPRYNSIRLKEKAYYPSSKCLDFKSLNESGESYFWQIKLVKELDEIESKLFP